MNMLISMKFNFNSVIFLLFVFVFLVFGGEMMPMHMRFLLLYVSVYRQTLLEIPAPCYLYVN